MCLLKQIIMRNSKSKRTQDFNQLKSIAKSTYSITDKNKCRLYNSKMQTIRKHNNKSRNHEQSTIIEKKINEKKSSNTSINLKKLFDKFIHELFIKIDIDCSGFITATKISYYKHLPQQVFYFFGGIFQKVKQLGGVSEKLFISLCEEVFIHTKVQDLQDLLIAQRKTTKSPKNLKRLSAKNTFKNSVSLSCDSLKVSQLFMKSQFQQKLNTKFEVQPLKERISNSTISKRDRLKIQLQQFNKNKSTCWQKNSKPKYFEKQNGLSYCQANKTKKIWEDNYDSLKAGSANSPQPRSYKLKQMFKMSKGYKMHWMYTQFISNINIVSLAFAPQTNQQIFKDLFIYTYFSIQQAFKVTIFMERLVGPIQHVLNDQVDQAQKSYNQNQALHQQNQTNQSNKHQHQQFFSSGTCKLNNQEFRQSFEQILPDQSNQCPFLFQWNNLSLDVLKQINAQMFQKPGDYAYFWKLWSRPDLKQIKQSLLFIVRPQNWPLYRCQFQKPLELFLHLYQNRMANQPYLNNIYPGLNELIKKLQSSTQLKGNKNNVKPQQNNSDLLFRHYLEEIKSRVKREGAFYIKDQRRNVKLPIGDFIAQEERVSKSYPWSDIYFKATIYKRNQQQKKQGDPDVNKQQQKKNLVSQQIINNGNTIYPADNHLCCAQYFFFNQKIYDQMITMCPVIFQRNFKQLEDQKSNQLQETVLDICALLNSGGGVILFNTCKTYLEIWPKGQSILQSQFSQMRNKIGSQIKFIKPAIEIGRQIFVNYVPLCLNPITNPNTDKVTQKHYIPGLYIMRIVVKPPEELSEYIYYYSKKQGQFRTAIIEKNVRKEIRKTQIRKYMRKKFDNYYVPTSDYQDQQQKSMIKRSYSWFLNHPTCLVPDKGQTINVKIQKDRQGNDDQLEKKFKYITLIVTQKAYFEQIREKLRSRGIECQLVIKYSQYRFKASHNSAALYHNLRFDHLLSEVAYKKQFQFNGRYILTILVTKYIKLMNRDKGNIMPEADFKTLQKWLHAEHPTERLYMWKYAQTEDECQFYMQAQTKLSTLFMYYVMNHYNQRCTFKNPCNFNHLNQQEKKTRFTQFYPRIK